VVFDPQATGEEERLVLLAGAAEIIVGDVAGAPIEAAFGIWFAAVVGVPLLLNLSGGFYLEKQR
jgi:hypothetical protein